MEELFEELKHHELECVCGLLPSVTKLLCSVA